MGDPSTLRFIPASSAAVPIDWTRVPEETKKLLIKLYGYDWEKKEDKPLPATIGDLANMFDETKFFGYFRSDIIQILMDISEFGLKPTRSNGPGWPPAGPRFYMEYINEMWFLLFAPGTRNCISGNEDIIRTARNASDDSDYEEEWAKIAAKETEMAQVFDAKLEREISLGRGDMVQFTNELGGWKAWTLQSDLESAQYREAIMKLPRSHPAHRALMEGVLHSLKERCSKMR